MDDESSFPRLENHISIFQNHVSSLSKSDPLRVTAVQTLAVARRKRYRLSRQREDLERAILHFTEALFLPPPWHGCSLNILQIFIRLTVSLFDLSMELKRPEDVLHCIMYLRYLQDQPVGVFASDFTPDDATLHLVLALAVKVELMLGDWMRDIEEIADLCHELLNSDIPTDDQEFSIMALYRVVIFQLEEINRQESLEKMISCLREANICLPDFHNASVALALSLLRRFEMTHLGDDYEEGTAVIDKVIAFYVSGDMPSPSVQMPLVAAVRLAINLSTIFRKPDHLEKMIYRVRTLLDLISPDHSDRPILSQVLSMFQAEHLDHFGIEGGRRDGPKSEIPIHPSFRDLTASLAESSPVTFTHVEHLNALLSTIRITNSTDLTEFEDALEYCRQLRASPLCSELAPVPSTASARFLFSAFRRTEKIEYLDEAISVIRDSRNTPGAEMFDLDPIEMLISYLSTRFELLQHEEDIEELMQLFPIAANNIRESIPRRFELSCEWASLARIFSHPSTTTAYDCAISSMQASFIFAPTLDVQHFRLVTMRRNYQLPLDYASYLVHRGQLEEAIVTIERGRALIWSEMRGLRTSIDKIRAANSDLADRFTAVNRDLEALTLTDSSGNNIEGGDDGLEGMDPFGRLVVRQQRLLDSREEVISQIQALPGFNTFLKPPSSDTLRSAALHGPIIIINHCKWRSDILILLHDSPPSLIRTSVDFYRRANELRDRLLGAREEGLESNDYEGALNSVLQELYELVGQPVVQRLDELHVPEQSRVWWCPTSAFCSLPLHAMGPIPSSDDSERYFLDLYISSYIPSLSALIESRNPGSETHDTPSILLVAQPDERMPEATKEMKVVKAVSTQVTTLSSKRATPTAVLGRLRDHPFAHIVCHGILEPGKPFDASFKLYGGELLSLLDIVRSRLPDAEFAFLSACHTAELTDESIADEVLHLTAAMQFCGFRSVVGTMWAMADKDGRDLARDFYRSVFSDQREGMRHYEVTAEALRDAVKRLRRRGGVGLERWVNFVHYGA